MTRRVLLIVLIVLLLIPIGGYFWLRANVDVITGAIGRAVESATGRPLILQQPPSISFFPQVGLDIGKATWGDPAHDDIAVDLHGAQVRVTLSSLVSKKIEIKTVTLDTPTITVRQKPAATTTENRNTEPEGIPASQVDSPEERKDAELSLDVLRINDGTVIVEIPDLNVRVTALNLDLADVALAKTGNLKTTAHVLLERKGIQPLETDLDVNTRFTLTPPMVALSNFTIKSGAVPGLLPAPLELSGTMNLNTSTLKSDLIDIMAAIAGSRVTLKGAADFKERSGQVDFGFESSNLTQALETLKIGAPSARQGLGALSLKGNAVLSGNALSLTTLQGRLDAPTDGTGGSVPLPLELHGGLNLDTKTLKSDKLDLAAFVAGTHLTVKGSASLGSPSGQVSFTVDSKNLKQTLAALGVGYTPQDPEALSAAVLKGNAKFTQTSVALAKLDGTLDGIPLKGSLSAALPGTVTASLSIGAVNADRYMPVKQPRKPPPAAGPQAARSATMRQPVAGTSAEAPKAAATQANPQTATQAKVPAYPSLDVDLSMQSLTIQDVRLDTVKAKIQGDKGVYRLAPCTFKAFESAVTASAAADLTKEQFSLKTTANHINAGQLLQRFAKTDKIPGRLNLTADMSVKGTTEAAIRNSLNGSTALSGQLNVDTGLLPSDWGRIVQNIRTIEISAIDAQARATNGVIALKPLNAEGRRFKTIGEGQINLPTDGLYVRLDTTLGDLTLPLLAGGTLSQPKYAVDAVSAVQSVLDKNPDLKERVQKELDRNSERIEKEIQRGAKNLEKELKKLFK